MNKGSITQNNHFLFSLFSGVYKFWREIQPQRVICHGLATMERLKSNEIIYQEKGNYEIDGRMQDFYQERIFKITDTHLHILKRDKHLLHEFPIEHKAVLPLILTHIHPCQKDLYTIDLEMITVDKFSTLYTVKGPYKNYKIDTQYERK